MKQADTSTSKPILPSHKEIWELKYLWEKSNKGEFYNNGYPRELGEPNY